MQAPCIEAQMLVLEPAVDEPISVTSNFGPSPFLQTWTAFSLRVCDHENDFYMPGRNDAGCRAQYILCTVVDHC